jgi:Flp pilus assembly pilin Flp
VQLMAIVFAVVYTGEHYLVDAFAGALYAVVAWRLVEWATGSRRAGSMRRIRAAAAHSGQALVEYALITSIVSIVAVGVLATLGQKVDVSFLPLLSAF